MMNKLCSLLILCLFHNLGNAQITDVFQNKDYYYSTFVLKAELDKDYAPGTVEILQDKNKLENESWKKIEEQLKAMAIQQIENEVAFFQLYTKALNYQKQLDEWSRLQEYSNFEQTHNPSFRSIEIKLVSILNNVGVYFIQYNFEIGNNSHDIVVRNYFLTDYQQNKITGIGSTPNLRQQEMLKKLTLSRFTAIYLLQTQKLDLDNVERIRATKAGKEEALFSSNINYSEALVYPYFSGIMVEFPAFSNSSKIFNNQSFRLLLKNAEAKELLSVYPGFKTAFKNPLSVPANTELMELNNDDNFDLARFRTAPKELKIWDALEAEKKIFSQKINYYQKSDTIKKITGSKKMFFDKNGQLSRIENRNDKDKITSEEKYHYNEKNQLIDVRISAYTKQLKLNFYENDILSYVENIELKHHREASYQEMVELDVSQEHFVYSNNYRYTLEFNLVGDFNRSKTIQSRYSEKNQYCTNHSCFLINENRQIVAVKKNIGSPIDVLVNEKNQPIESYFDYDRYRYFFTYDEKHRIKTFSGFSDGKLTDLVEYQYHQNELKPLTIIETKTSYSFHVIVQEYEVEFWEEDSY